MLATSAIGHSGARKRPADAAKKGPTISNAKGRGCVVLVVDDSEDNRLATRTALEGEGYRVLLAAGGLEAIRVFESDRPDCILLDVRMPDLDGVATCERIRALPGGPATPIIFMTALRDVETFDRALGAGGDDFLTKPLHGNELVNRVESVVRFRRMDDELREQYAVLKAQRDALLRASLEKERLMTFVVHDLKNPVNAMDLHAQVLLRDSALPPALHDSATRIRTEARLLTRMITDLLDLSRADEGAFSPKTSRVDVTAVVSAVIAELAITAESYEVELATSMRSEHVVADVGLLERALTNIVENALRHAPRHSRVRISVVSGSFGTDFYVADAGSGIAPELRERIFEPFVRLQLATENPSSAARTGRGLGLAFCKLVAEAHGGSIRVEDGAPGAVFIRRLPPLS